MRLYPDPVHAGRSHPGGAPELRGCHMALQIDGAARVGFRRGLRWAAVLGALGATVPAQADTTLLKVADAAAQTHSAPVTMQFQVSRFGDLGYDAVVGYHTVDGTAVAGLDYEAAVGSILIPAGSASATIPVTVNPRGSAGGELAFQLDLAGVGVGAPAQFGPMLSFAAGTTPAAVIAADLNGDGRLDLVTANFNGDSIAVLLNMSMPVSPLPMFAPQQNFVAGTRLAAIAAADINGDGRLDLVVVDNQASTVAVLLNTTPPGASAISFAPLQSYAVEANPSALAIADLNGDGKADLVVTSPGSGMVSVLFNTTAPGAPVADFASRQSFAAGADVQALALADLDGDGRLDVVVSNTNANSLSVLLNTTAPGATSAGFMAVQTFVLSHPPGDVTAVDLNGDGRPDIVVTSPGGNAVSALMNTTAANAAAVAFASERVVDTGNAPLWVVATDTNGDGKPDLAITYAIDNTVSVVLNQTLPGSSEPQFGMRTAIPAGNGPALLAAADLSGDGRADFVVGTLVGNAVTVIPAMAASNQVAANLADAASFGVGGFPISANVADFDGDGLPDVAAANLVAASVSVLINTTARGAAAPAFAGQQSFPTGSGPRGSASGDFNGDGKPDLVTANENDNTVSVLLNTTAAAGAPAFAAHQDFAVGGFAFGVAVADFNGDGRADIVAVNAHDGTASVLLNTTAPGALTASFAAQQTFETGPGANSVAVADVNGDGLPDLIVSSFSQNVLAVLVNTTPLGATTPSFAAHQDFAVGRGSNWGEAFDVNGDGLPDLVSTDSVDNTVSVLINTSVRGSATLAFGDRQIFAAGAKPSHVAAADLDGDGRLDLIVSNMNSDNVSVLLNTTMAGAPVASFAAQQVYAAQGAIAAAARDVNGDGRPDLFVANSSASSVSVLLNKQYQVKFDSNSATGTITRDLIFANGFEAAADSP